MRAYVMTTGVVFALIALAHVLRMISEGPRLVTEPLFLILTIAAAALAVWAWRVLPRTAR